MLTALPFVSPRTHSLRILIWAKASRRGGIPALTLTTNTPEPQLTDPLPTETMAHYPQHISARAGGGYKYYSINHF